MTYTRTGRTRTRVPAWLCAIIALVAGMLLAATASALPAVGAENRVRASTPPVTESVGLPVTEIPDQRPGNPPSPASVAVATSVAANTGAKIDPAKFDYLFGKVSSNAHNSARSAQNASRLSRVGVYDDGTGRALIQQHLDGVVGDESSILRTFTNTHGDFQIRESLFVGPGGFVKFESTWQVLDDGLRLTTLIPMGR